jgi:hypothetical protein
VNLNEESTMSTLPAVILLAVGLAAIISLSLLVHTPWPGRRDRAVPGDDEREVAPELLRRPLRSRID